MKNIFAVLGILLLVSTSSQAQPKKISLAIFAYPDDEGTIGPVLEKYASVGTKVYLEKVIELFVILKPDVIITWGPSGWTGHPDHRLNGAIVTEVFASKVWGQPANLFYPELVTGSLSARSVLTTMDSSYLPVKIPLVKADYDKATISQNFHKSQYTIEQALNFVRVPGTPREE